MPPRKPTPPTTSLEIILPDQKPALEWLMGRAVPKMSPRTRHALLQGACYRALDDWSAGRYLVGTEWRFRLAPPGEIRRPLVPDVAVLPRDGLRGLEDRDFDGPPYGPTIVLEVLSPGDRRTHLDHKRDVFFACGTLLMLVVDPAGRCIEASQAPDAFRRFEHDDHVTSEHFPDMHIAVRSIFTPIAELS